MGKNRSFTGSRRAVGTPTLTKEQYFQLIRKIRNAAPPNEDGKSGERNMKQVHTNTKEEKVQ